MHRLRFAVPCVVGLGLGFVAIARAQIDNRVRPSNQARDGRLLDANTQVGAGGFNYRTPQIYNFDYGVRAREIITGNVSGLAGFHADSPIIANNAFRVDLPSGGLAPFRARTAGLPEVTSGLLRYGPSSYYDPQQIIADTGAIRRGMNLPGSSYLVTPYRSPLMPFEREVQSELQPPDPFEARAHDPARLVPTIRQVPLESPATGDRLQPANPLTLPYAPPYSDAAASSIFGAPLAGTLDRSRSTELGGMDTQARGLYAPPLSGLTAGSADATLRDGRVATDTPLAPGSPFGIQPSEFEKSTVSGTRPVEADLPAPAKTALPSDGPLEPKFQSTPLAPGDRFGEMAAAVKEAQDSGAGVHGLLSSDRPAASSKRELAATPADTDREVQSVAAMAKWGRAIDDPVKSFVGKYPGRVNEYMRSAEDALKKGHYYDAAGYYEIAMTADPDNPLSYLGRGHALAAAGDYLSAVLSIERGLARFPQIAAFRLDLPAIVGRADAFDIRRADLERRLSTADDYRMRFLLGYLELYSGLDERGLRDLQTAAKSAPAGSIIAAFPDLLTGRQTLPPLPAGR
ncbi:MAG TPA: tetratricopeptide repeat protein [Phycisphaerae bacterium]|nr:tetratricopeptide repeat protein [Phycisphaerae bacterium]